MQIENKRVVSLSSAIIVVETLAVAKKRGAGASPATTNGDFYRHNARISIAIVVESEQGFCVKAVWKPSS